jgi:hypothetical protein
MVMPGGPTAGDPNNPEGLPADSTDPKALLDRIKLLEEKIRYLESNVVLTDPETRVRKKVVYVDKNGVEYDSPPARREENRHLRTRACFRRNNINEKIEEPWPMRKNTTSGGVNAGIVTQFAHRTTGARIQRWHDHQDNRL